MHPSPRAAPPTLTTQGARNVRCSVCGYINNVSMLWRGLTPAQEFARSRNLAQITCTGCRTTLLYPQGASAVQCAVCRTLNPVRPVRAVCASLLFGRAAAEDFVWRAGWKNGFGGERIPKQGAGSHATSD